MSGSVEAACGLGLADAVVDLVETGTTMIVRRPTYYDNRKQIAVMMAFTSRTDQNMY